MSVLHGFEQTRQRRIDELDAALHEYIHTGSSGRMKTSPSVPPSGRFRLTIPAFFTFWSILFSAARSTSRSKSRLSN